jgi:hypothetical protein
MMRMMRVGVTKEKEEEWRFPPRRLLERRI